MQVETLLELGCNPEKVAATHGGTALLVSAQHGHRECVEALLEHGVASLDKRSAHGIAPLFVAAQGGHLEIVSHSRPFLSRDLGFVLIG